MFNRILLISSVFLALSSCSAGEPVKVTKPAPVEKLMVPPTVFNVQPSAYKIGVGDEVELKFFFTPELNDRMTVRPDGKISIMFAQDVQAAGYTAEELQDLIKRKLAPHVKQLDMVVVVRTFASQKVFVGGEVAKPGPIVLTNRENLLQVVNEAGWVTPVASREKMFLVRRGEDGKDAIYPINFSKIMSGEDMSQNVMLQPGDLVLVPPSGVTQTDRWVDQNMRQMIPIGAGVFVSPGGR
jgi:protein involved in polysaccharide export with SLBB domain